MKKIVFIGLFIAVIISFVSVSFAEHSIIPSFSLEEKYTDNLFLTEDNEEDDFITTASPNILLKYSPNSKLDVDLNYGLNFKFYSNHSEFNDTSLRETQHAELLAQVRPFSRVIIDISDAYKRVPIDSRKRGALENVVVNSTESNTFTISPYITVPFTSTLSTTVGYLYINKYYKQKEIDGSDIVDSESHSAFITLDKKFSSKATGMLKYNYLMYRPDLDRDVAVFDEYDRHDVSIGGTYKVLTHIQMNGEIGVSKFDYKNEEDSKSIFWNVGVFYGPVESTSMSISYMTSFDDSTTSGGFKSSEIDVLFETGKVLKVKVNPYYNVNKFLLSSRKDKILGVVVDLSRPLTKRITAMVDMMWEKVELIPDTGQLAKVQKYRIGSSLEYIMSRHITASLGYTYNGRDSDEVNDDFDNNEVWLMAKLTY